MNGRERIEAAFSLTGTPEIPAVICYEGLVIRDHWPQLCARPWWVRWVPDLESQSAWRRDAVGALGHDWFELPFGPTRSERACRSIEERDGEVYLVDRCAGYTERLVEPAVGGWTRGGVASVHPTDPPQTAGDVDERLGDRGPAVDLPADGQGDLAQLILSTWGGALYPIGYTATPLWSCYHLWGFEGLMLALVDRPDVVRHAAERFTDRAVEDVRAAARLGARGVWIEDCMTDMIGPEHFRAFNLPYLRRITDEIRGLGMRGIHYFCGSPAGKWDLLLDSGADALALEESKKGFTIDIDEVVERTAGRMAVLGNLDAIHLLEHGTEEALRAEIRRQVAAGRRNCSRFIMSLGSPVTPGTPISRVRLYCDLVHELGRQ